MMMMRSGAAALDSPTYVNMFYFALPILKLLIEYLSLTYGLFESH